MGRWEMGRWGGGELLWCEIRCGAMFIGVSLSSCVSGGRGCEVSLWGGV